MANRTTAESTSSRPDRPSDGTPPSKGISRILIAIVLPCLIGIGLIVARAATFGTPTALLAIGPDNASYPLVHRELPHAHVFEGNGFDGMVFYVIARRPFDVRATSKEMYVPTYRLRRILYPMLAKPLSPSGGVGLVYAFAALSLVGIAIGGWALSRFPNGPPWLPITMVVNAGTICALWTSTADALAAGLTVAAIGAMLRRRFTAAIILLALAGLTRETSLVAVVALAAWPGISVRRRVAHLVVPALPVGVWSVYVSVAIGQSMFEQPDGGTFTAPFLGWIREPPVGGQLVLAIFTGCLIAVAMWIGWHRYRAISLYLAATLAMFVCATTVIVDSWLGFSRITIVAFPLSIWIVIARVRAPQAFKKRARYLRPA